MHFQCIVVELSGTKLFPVTDSGGSNYERLYCSLPRYRSAGE
jgi:hypothetical protein